MRTIITLAVAIAGFAAISAPAVAAKDLFTDAERLGFTATYATAVGLAEACPAWRLNKALVPLELAEVGIDPAVYEDPGPLGDLFRKAVKEASELEPTTACDFAEMQYGPEGKVRNFMKKR